MVFLNIWFLASFLLSCFPIGFGRLFLNGLLFPLVLINLLSYKDVALKFQTSSWLIILILAIASPLSSIHIFTARINETKKQNPWYYLPLEIKAGFEFLEKEKNSNGVLALPLLSSYIPAWTGKNVYCGHKDQTPNFEEKLAKIINFYSGKFSLKEGERFLKDNKIDFVAYSQEEKQLGVLNYPFLKSSYKNEKIEILKKRS